jgi:hypothetical protein
VIEFSSFCDTLRRYVVASDTSIRTCRYFRLFATRFENMSLATTCRERTRTGQRARSCRLAVSSPIISRMIFSPASIGSISVLIPVKIYPRCFFRNSSERSFASFAASAL